MDLAYWIIWILLGLIWLAIGIAQIFNLAKKKTKRRRRTVISGSDIVGCAIFLHGLVGLDNLIKGDWDAAAEKLAASLMDPLAPGGLIDDFFTAMKAFGMTILAEKILLALAGKLPGFNLGKYRIRV